MKSAYESALVFIFAEKVELYAKLDTFKGCTTYRQWIWARLHELEQL